MIISSLILTLVQDPEGDDPDKTGFNLNEQDLVDYVTKLADYAHSQLRTQRGLPLMFGQKNARALSQRLQPITDFAVLEECLGTRIPSEEHPIFCDNFQNFVKNATNPKPVFEIEYPLSVKDHDTKNMNRDDWIFFCQTPNGNNQFSEVIKHSSDFVDGWGQYCSTSETEGTFNTTTLDE